MSITTVRTVALVEGAPVTFRLPEGDGWATGTVLYTHVGRARIDCPETAEDYWVGTEDVITHVDYPHEPGYLIDCPACERACHCSDATCVNCQDQAARDLEVDEWEEGRREAEDARDAYAETDLWDAPGIWE